MKKSLLIVLLIFITNSVYAANLRVTSTVKSLRLDDAYIKFKLHDCDIGTKEFRLDSFDDTDPGKDAKTKANFAILLAAFHAGSKVSITFNGTCDIRTSDAPSWNLEQVTD